MHEGHVRTYCAASLMSPGGGETMLLSVNDRELRRSVSYRRAKKMCTEVRVYRAGVGCIYSQRGHDLHNLLHGRAPFRHQTERVSGKPCFLEESLKAMPMSRSTNETLLDRGTRGPQDCAKGSHEGHTNSPHHANSPHYVRYLMLTLRSKDPVGDRYSTVRRGVRICFLRTARS